MWVFDGEDWKEEGSERRERERSSEASLPQWDATMPELQIVEYVPTPATRHDYVPPLPMP